MNNDLNQILMNYIRNNDLISVNSILNHNFELTNFNYNPLALACWLGHIEIVELFIQNGVNFQYNNNELLKLSCLNENLDMMKLLIHHKSNYFACFDELLKLAYRNKNIDIINYLMQLQLKGKLYVS